ncbi:hypothetical protein GPJ56_010592 [Histomonas meleagridis]|uniref:uncharacterized protein n=1 Tax=Histomonas meleagridis TaxID=135588 RepID=UPI0035594190|nr:hypothetical protein GPJ56_010592 [Histomonas meleagridis]KAH0803987.1 hypothetical protein GO595_002817 [Histomonas meleagridis]
MAELDKELAGISDDSDDGNYGEQEIHKNDNHQYNDSYDIVETTEIKKVVRLDEEESKQKRIAEIEEKAKLVDQTLNELENPPNDEGVDDFDIDSFNLEWKYSTPSIQ